MKYAHQGNPDLTWETLSDVARYSLERCIDRVRDGQEGLVKEGFDNGETYAYACGSSVNYGINGEDGCNIFRGQRSLSHSGDERKHPMPKKLKLKDWQDEVRRTKPEMFDGGEDGGGSPAKPLKLVDPKPSPLAQPQQKLTTEEKKTTWRRALGWFK